MRILLITMEYPPFRGGVGNYYFNLVQNCGEVEMQVLVHDKDSRFKIQDSSKSQITKSKIQVSNKLFFYRYIWPKWLKLFFIVRKIIKQEKYDLIWVGQVLPVGAVAYLISKFYGIPYFVSTHGMDIMVPQKSVRKKKLMINILQSAGFITANSEYTKRQLVKLCMAANKIEVIYPCPNISSKNQESTIKEDQSNKVQVIKDKYGLNNKQVLLTVGRLVKRKGHEQVIEAMSRLVPKYTNLVYLIIGDGPEFSYLESHISYLGLNNCVKILNNVGDEELPLYYQSADIFIMPAREIEGDVEGFGIVYLEAAGFGLPVIAGKAGGAPEAVIDGQTGILVNPTSVKEIAAAIVNLLNNESYRKELGENGQKRVKQEFNWPKEAAKLSVKIKNLA